MSFNRYSAYDDEEVEGKNQHPRKDKKSKSPDNEGIYLPKADHYKNKTSKGHKKDEFSQARENQLYGD